MSLQRTLWAYGLTTAVGDGITAAVHAKTTLDSAKARACPSHAPAIKVASEVLEQIEGMEPDTPGQFEAAASLGLLCRAVVRDATFRASPGDRLLLMSAELVVAAEKGDHATVRDIERATMRLLGSL